MADEPREPAPAPGEPETGPARPAVSSTSTATEISRDPGTGYAPAAGTGQHRGPLGRAGNGPDLLPRFLAGVHAGWRRGITLLASAVMIAAVILAVIFAVHILFVVFSANPGNSIVEFINRWAGRFAWQFTDLFTPHSQRVAALANYGIAAIAYLIAGRILSGLIRRLA